MFGFWICVPQVQLKKEDDIYVVYTIYGGTEWHDKGQLFISLECQEKKFYSSWCALFFSLYLYCNHRAIRRPSDHPVRRPHPRAKVRTRYGRCMKSGLWPLKATLPHNLFTRAELQITKNVVFTITQYSISSVNSGEFNEVVYRSLNNLDCIYI